MKDNQAIYQLNEAGNQRCKWQVNFLGDSIFIKTLDNVYDCDFGGNVIADGAYKLVGHKVPEYFIGREGDTTYFNK